MLHVVFGASGRAGGETARALIERGEQVRVVVRRPAQGEAWAALGASVALASLEDADAVSAALAGATSAFLLNPPPVADDPFEQTAVIGAAISDAVRRAALPRAVVLSSVGAQHASGTGVIATLHQIETALARTAPAVAFLRPGYFIETWEEVAATAAAEGIMPTFLDPELRLPMVSTTDVGRAAARLMCEDRPGCRIVELSGPDDWSAGDVAAAFAEALGRPVRPMYTPPEQGLRALTDAGIAPAVAGALLGMYEGIANGRVTRQEGTEHWRGAVSLTAAVARIAARLRSTS